MIVTYDPPRPPAPILSAAEKFSHVPKKLAEAETERIQAEAKLARISEKEQAGTELAQAFKTLCARRDALAAKIGSAAEQRAGFVEALEGARWGILERVGDRAVEGFLVQQAAVMLSWEATVGHIERFLEIRRKELSALEAEIQTFAKTNGIEYPVK